MEVSGQLHAPAASSGKRAHVTHWLGGWMGPSAGLYSVEGRKIPSLCRESNSGRPEWKFQFRFNSPREIPVSLSWQHMVSVLYQRLHDWKNIVPKESVVWTYLHSTASYRERSGSFM